MRKGIVHEPSHAKTHDASELRQLLERVKAASGPSVELFYAIARTVLPDTFTARWDHDEERVHWRVLTFDKFIGAGAWTDAALALVERVLPGFQVNLHIYELDAEASLGAWAGEFAPKTHVVAKTPALALLAALLKALQADALSPPQISSGRTES